MSTLCETIKPEIGALFTCSPVNEYMRIRTPFLYPDGDVIDLYVKETPAGKTLTDLGESLRWLRNQSLSQRRSTKQRQLIEDICLNHGIEFYKGMLMLRVRTEDDWGKAVMRLAQASLRVSDLWFTFRTRSVESLADEVADYLSEKSMHFERCERLPGRSGRVWPVDFHTRTPDHSSFLYVLSTGSRGAARGVVDHITAAWYDLSHLKTGPEAIRFVSLFDDTMDVWQPEDFRLVGDLSDIARWSRPEELITALSA